MALRQSSPRANRYKKNGKGGFALAVFLVFVCALMVGGYLLHYYQQQRNNKISSRTDTFQSQPTQHTSPKPVHLPPTTPQPTAITTTSTRDTARPDYSHNNDIQPTQQLPQPVIKPVSGKAELAIIIDDMGSSLQEARSLAGIGVPITFAIIPGLRHDREVAHYATGQGIEIMIHMPMQSREYPQRRLEANGLLLEQSDEELRSRVLDYLNALPQAVGANNHMGSGFTEHPDKMRVVLKLLKEKGLFYVDSITTPKTTGLKVAAECRLPASRRDVFLDNEQKEEYIRGQLEQAVARARKNGHAIAICHPHPTTISTLTKTLPELQSKGVTLVKITKLVAK
ncbi:MAG: divergent polysaccharide deacetylase family protein [Geobacter sp.]|nr:divergent polysaccharide deacetylase family protein [Geobacter sp.]